MFSILSFFFMRGREAAETEVSTREEVDCDTWHNYGEEQSAASPDPGDEGCQMPKSLTKEEGFTGVVTKWPAGACWSWTHLPHNLPAIEKHFVPLPESVPRALRGGGF